MTRYDECRDAHGGDRVACAIERSRAEARGTTDAPSSSIMEILAWIIVGLVSGVLASLVVGGTGYGILGDIVIGIVGAFVGGYIFRAAGWSAPWGGLAGTIFVAFIGAVVSLVILHLIQGASTRGRRTL